MKKKYLKNLIITTMMAFAVASCLNTDDDEKVYSAAQEKLERGAYLDSLQAKGHDIDTTELGVYYIVIEEGEGDFAKAGDTLTVGYAGYFIDGILFDASDIYYPDGKMKFVLENPPMIPGWDDGMKVMNKNARVQFIVPSELAYGSEGWGVIPPYQTLIFVVKMFDIKPSDSN